jgi:hypothetical protein
MLRGSRDRRQERSKRTLLEEEVYLLEWARLMSCSRMMAEVEDGLVRMSFEILSSSISRTNASANSPSRPRKMSPLVDHDTEVESTRGGL